MKLKTAGETPVEVTDRKGRRLVKKLDYADGEVPPGKSCEPLEWTPGGLAKRGGRGRCLHPNCRRCWAEGVNRLYLGLRGRAAAAAKLGMPPLWVGFKRTSRLAAKRPRGCGHRRFPRDASASRPLSP